MRALRTKMRFGGWLALLALGLQLTLLFGHIHAEDFAPANVVAAGQGQTAPDSHRNDNDRDGCAICAVMHMAATSFVPTPPFVALRPAAAFVTLVTLDRSALPPAARQPFQARAPPQA